MDRFTHRLRGLNLSTARQAADKANATMYNQCYNTQNIQSPNAQLLANLFNRGKTKSVDLWHFWTSLDLWRRGANICQFLRKLGQLCAVRFPQLLTPKQSWRLYVGDAHLLHKENTCYIWRISLMSCVCLRWCKYDIQSFFKFSLSTCCQISMHH